MTLRISMIAVLMTAVPLLKATTLYGPEYPPPGGVTFSSTGAGSGNIGGKTFNYSGFDPTQYSELYWGPLDVVNVNNVGDPAAADMTYVGLNAGNYEFDSTANWTFNGSFTGTLQLPTRMLLSVTGLGTEASQGSLGAPSPNGSYPLFLVTGSFSANFVFEVNYGGNWIPVNDFQNANNNLGPLNQKSVTFDFFNTVPEPSSYIMFAFGGALIAFRAARRTRRTQ